MSQINEDYLIKRNKYADLHHLSNNLPFIKQIPGSNGSKYFKKYNINVGFVMDDLLYQTYKDAANFYYITKENYQKYKGKLDILIISSTWVGLNGEWSGVASPKAAIRKSLYKIIQYYSEQGVKTVFYSKEDPVNYARFLDIAKRCQYIFTTSAERINYYKNDTKNDNVFLLEFCINPLNHNPIGFRNYKKQNEVIFSGSWLSKYPERQIDMYTIFDGILEAGFDLKIIDRNFSLNNEKYFFPEKYLKYISPSISQLDLYKIHKLYNWAINFNSVKDSTTMFASRVYELLALGNSIVSNFNTGMHQKFPNIFIAHDKNEIKSILSSLNNEDLYQHQIEGIRKVMSSHTNFERFDYLLKCIGYNFKSTNRNILIVANKMNDQSKISFDRQLYPNKRLISVEDFNEGIKRESDMVTFFNSDYDYEEYYILDLVNGFKYTNSDYITKVNSTGETPHNYTAKINDKYRTAFWSNSFNKDQLISIESNTNLPKGYMIDHYEIKDKQNIKIKQNKSKYQLSLIIPVYNNGAFLLNTCINSLKRSSIFNNTEIIIVDDGSKDIVTRRIIKNLEVKYPNVRAYYFKEGGSGSASRPRNKGIELATSDYITFLDPDNEAVNDGYAELLKEAKKDRNLDIIIGDIVKIYENKKRHFKYYSHCKNRNKTNVSSSPRKWLINTDLKPHSIQALIVKRELIKDNNLKMIEGAGGQDSLFFYELMLHAKKIKVINHIIHIYYADIPGSITNNISSSFYNKWLLLENNRLPFLIKHNLLHTYMDVRFNNYFKEWYLKKLIKVKKEHLRQSIDTLYRIYNLYRRYITKRDKDLIVFEKLYKQKEYAKIYSYFTKGTESKGR